MVFYRRKQKHSIQLDVYLGRQWNVFLFRSWKLYVQLNKTVPNCLLEQNREGRSTSIPEWYFSFSLENPLLLPMSPGCQVRLHPDLLHPGVLLPLEFLCWSQLLIGYLPTLLLPVITAECAAGYPKYCSKTKLSGFPLSVFLSLSHCNCSCLLLGNAQSDWGLFSCLEKRGGRTQWLLWWVWESAVVSWLALYLKKTPLELQPLLLGGFQALTPQNCWGNSKLTPFPIHM